MPVVVGSPPSARQKALDSAAKTISPEKSVERLDGLAKYIIGNSALVAGTLTALGVFTDLGDRFDDQPLAFVAPLIFVTLSVIAALGALFPFGTAFNPEILSDVEEFFNGRIRFKLKMVFGAFLFLIVAVVSALAPAGVSIWDADEPNPQVTLSWNRNAPTDKAPGVEVSIVGSVKLTDVSPGTRIDAVVTGRDPSGAEVVVFRASSIAGDDGDVDVPIKLVKVDSSLDWILATDVVQDEAIIHREIELHVGQVADDRSTSLHPWGDVDCSGGDVIPVDSLKILRYDAGLSVKQEVGCPAIGVDVTLVE